MVRPNNSDGQRLVPENPSGAKPRLVLYLAATVAIVSGAALARYYGVHLFSSDPPPQISDTSSESTRLTTSATVPVKMGPSWEKMDDPSHDGWETEVFHQKSKLQLKEVEKLCAHPDEITPARLAELVSLDFACGLIVPMNLRTVFEDRNVRVVRADMPNRPGPVRVHQGAAGLAAALKSLVASFDRAAALRWKFKVFRVERLADSFATRQYFSLAGRRAGRLVEQNAIWRICWTVEENGPPKLKSIDVEEFEQVTTTQPGKTLFADCTESVLGHNDCFRSQFHRGLNYWLERSQDHGYFPLLGASGITVGDVNGDGLDDLYVCQEEGLPNRLFVQNVDGTARDVSREAGVDWLEATRSALLIDLDNDSDQDIVIATIGNVVVAANDGTGRFKLRCVLGVNDDAMSLSACDYDNDGDLDLYVCVNYANDGIEGSVTQSMAATSAGFVYHDANNGGGNTLFRNDGDWQFADVTAEAGLDVHNRRYSLAASWEDFDNDGDQDLYVANDYGRNNLYRNEGSEDGSAGFVDVASAASVEDSASGMSVSWGDYNRDGLIDLYVSNMFSSAGNRIAFQDAFKPNAPDEVRLRLRRFARGNTLLENLGGSRFRDVSTSAAVTMGRWAWSSSFVDLNNDGWEDLVVANGYITTPDTGDL